MISETEALSIFKELKTSQEKYKENPSKTNKLNLTKIENIVHEKFSYIINSKIYKYKQFSNYEDLKQEAFHALFKSFNTYKEQKEQKGSIFWWVNKYVETRVKRVANKHTVVKVPLVQASKQQPMQEQITNRVIKDHLENSEDANVFETNEMLSKINNICKKMPQEDVNILFDYFGINDTHSPKTISQISIEYKIPKISVQKTINSSLKEIQNLCQT